MLSKLERQDFLAEVITEITQSNIKTKKELVSEIYVDPNFQYSEDAKFGYELSKNPIAWKKYFEN